MRYLRIFGLYFRIGAMGEMQYRFNFFVHLFQSILQLGMALGGLAVIFTYTNTLGGWLPDEVLALVGVYTLVGGLIGLVVYPSMEQFIMSVRDGMLDFMLVKPVDAQLLNSLQSVDIWRLIDIGLGLGVLIIALVRLGTQVGLGPGGPLHRHAAHRQRHHLFILDDAGDALILVRAGREHPGDLPQHVRGRALADQSVSALAAFHPELHRPGGIRHHRARRGADGSPQPADVVHGCSPRRVCCSLSRACSGGLACASTPAHPPRLYSSRGRLGSARAADPTRARQE